MFAYPMRKRKKQLFFIPVWKKYQARAPFRAFIDTPSPLPQSPEPDRSLAVPDADVTGYITSEADIHQEASPSGLPTIDLLPNIEEEVESNTMHEIDLNK